MMEKSLTGVEFDAAGEHVVGQIVVGVNPDGSVVGDPLVEQNVAGDVVLARCRPVRDVDGVHAASVLDGDVRPVHDRHLRHAECGG